MAAMMETLYSTSGFTSENSLTGRVNSRTPPFTPARPRHGKRTRLERSDSPASITSSVHPKETVSPGQKPAKRIATDNIRVEELAEGDVGYYGDVDVVDPNEVEEMSGSDGDDQLSTATDVSDTEEANLTRKLSDLRCDDDRQIFEQQRRRLHRERRESRLFKRSHSQSVLGDAEDTDTDAMADHDLESSQRRLRRRTKGPYPVDFAVDELPRSSPSVPQSPTVPNILFSPAHESGDEKIYVRQCAAVDAMDVDE